MPKMIKIGEIRVLSYFHLSWNEPIERGWSLDETSDIRTGVTSILQEGNDQCPRPHAITYTRLIPTAFTIHSRLPL